MNKSELIEYIKLNISTIYNSFMSVFDFEKEDIEALIINLIKSFSLNERLNEKEYSASVFSEETLKGLKDEFKKLGIDSQMVKSIIIKSPIIILYADKLNSIYYLYKNKNYYGYTILDNYKYDTYLLNNNINSNIISNNYIIDKMLNYYDITEYKNENFEKLESDFKLKNYYFKKK